MPQQLIWLTGKVNDRFVGDYSNDFPFSYGTNTNSQRFYGVQCSSVFLQWSFCSKDEKIWDLSSWCSELFIQRKIAKICQVTWSIVQTVDPIFGSCDLILKIYLFERCDESCWKVVDVHKNMRKLVVRSRNTIISIVYLDLLEYLLDYHSTCYKRKRQRMRHSYFIRI